MGQPAARITDMHTCPMVTGVVPHVGGPVVLGSTNVLTGGLPQARVTDSLTCAGGPDMIAKGSTGVFVNKLPAARLGDLTAHGGVIVVGLPTVLIGDGGGGGAGGSPKAGKSAMASSSTPPKGPAAAGRAQMAFVHHATQVKVLVNAAKSGAAFCEPCFRAAQAAAHAKR